MKTNLHKAVRTAHLRHSLFIETFIDHLAVHYIIVITDIKVEFIKSVNTVYSDNYLFVLL